MSAKYNLVSFEREVFGVPLFELTECELPDADEEVGAILTTREQIDGFIAENRERILAARARLN